VSRVYFHSPSGEAELLGAERHQFGLVVREAALRRFDLGDRAHRQRIRDLITRDGQLKTMDTDDPRWAKWVETTLSLSDPLLGHGGRDIGTFSLRLNTALVDADDVTRLVARLDGQCEIHSYVEGPNRAWLADLMQRALDSGLLRSTVNGRDIGWEGVIGLLRSRDDEPVVTSYSVCDWFPSADVALGPCPPMPVGWYPPGWDEEDRAEWEELEHKSDYWEEHLRDRWGAQPAEDQWEQAMAALRGCDRGLELKPDDWGTFAFTHELSAVDLYADDYADRITAALDRLEATQEPEWIARA
jgi:hypothetical protein